ncbi:MAG: molybdopterin molybdotransferase MoeA [Acidimicrobiia bacterium]
MLIPFDEVRRTVLDAVPVLEGATVPLLEALGLVTVAPLAAAEPIPPFANTAMDGYALRATDTTGAGRESPVRLDVVGEIPAGRAPTVAVGPGQAIRIMTGGPMPDGADAVLMVERTERDGADGVRIFAEARPGDHVRRAGGDLAEGTVAFPAGTVLGPAHLGVVASLGHAHVDVVRRPRVAVMSTGDELVPPGGGPLELGKIRDSNRPMLIALVNQAGCEAVDFGITRDDEEVMTSRLEEAVATCDALVTSGGVSVGDYDIVKAVLDRMGKLSWFQVAIKPAKPFAFGVFGTTPVFGLPGNPVSSHVSFEMFARPALLQMMGQPHRFRPVRAATAAHAMPRPRDGKLHLDRVRVERDGDRLVAASTGVQASNVLSAMAMANALAMIPDGEGVAEGGTVEVMLLERPADH